MSILTFEFNNRRLQAPTVFELEGKSIVPCQFCGSSSIGMDSDESWWWCCCMTCGVEGPARKHRIHAVKKWQIRNVEELP